ncbi:MAG: AAA family ATPase [Nitrospirae bacterium]|nr:AAA family ATPase [Nitrospirota bacterium]
MSNKVFCDLATEQALLGTLALLSDGTQKIRELFIAVEDFHNERHRIIFKTMRELSDSGSPIDYIILSHTLREKNMLPKVGGDEYLRELICREFTTVNYRYYEKIIRELATKRKFDELSVAFQDRLSRGDDSTEISDFLTEYLGNLKSQGTNDNQDFLSKALISASEIRALDIKIEWALYGLIPLQSITLLAAPAGMGKTTLALQVAEAIATGAEFLGLKTTQRPVVYIDFENSLPVIAERLRRLVIKVINLWLSSNKIPPSRLDTKDVEYYKKLPAGAVLIFDTLRASHGLDENSSRDMQIIMQKLKELRDVGFTIVLLHHTLKANDKQYKGSTAILDLCDQSLVLSKVRKGTDVELNDDTDTADFCYRVGTSQKTRYQPIKVHLEFSPEKGFYRAADPVDTILEQIRDLILGFDKTPNQSAIVEAAKKLELSRKQVLTLLKKGNNRFWTADKGVKNTITYSVVPMNWNNRGENVHLNTPQTRTETELSSCSGGIETTNSTNHLQKRKNTHLRCVSGVVQLFPSLYSTENCTTAPEAILQSNFPKNTGITEQLNKDATLSVNPPSDDPDFIDLDYLSGGSN